MKASVQIIKRDFCGNKVLELVFIVRGTANVRKACKPDIISTVFKGKKRAEVTALINIMCGVFIFSEDY